MLIRTCTKWLLPLLVFSFFFFIVEAKYSLLYSSSEDIEKNISESQKKLNDYNKKLLLEKSKLEKLKENKADILYGIEKLNNLIAARKKELETYKKEYEKNLLLLNELQEKIDQQAGRLSSARERLGKKLRAVYKNGMFRRMEIIYNSKNYLDLIRKIKLLQIISKNDAGLIEAFKDGIRELEETKKNLTDSKNKSLEIVEKIKTAEKEILMRKSEKERLLAEINSDEKRRTASLEKLENDSKNLQDLVKNLLKKKTSSQEIAKGKKNLGKLKTVKGSLPWPVQGRIIKLFGKQLNQELNTYLYNRGITISVESERKFTSIFAGTILFADNFSGYGKLIIIDHGGGLYSVYGNAGEIYAGVGEKATQGKILGKVDGELYFEIRYRGSPQDPLMWLKKE